MNRIGTRASDRRPAEKLSTNAVMVLLLAVIILISLTGCRPGAQHTLFPSGHRHEEAYTVSLEEIPEWSGEPSVVVLDGQPRFDLEENRGRTFETYARLDVLGRCGTAYACIGVGLMPDGPIDSIQRVHPSGWANQEYDFVDGGYVYNRCHLIGYQLTGESDNERNLITGTRYMNVKGMLPYENEVADHIIDRDHHVLYRVTPIFRDVELVCRGVQMEAYCIECGTDAENDDGKFMFNVFCYNVQPGVKIDYLTGENRAAE